MSNPSPGAGSTHSASAGSFMNFIADVSTMRTVAPVFSAGPRICATTAAHDARPCARRIRSASRVSPDSTHCATARRSRPPSAAAQNSAGICVAACSDQNPSASVPLVRTASVNAVARRVATASSSQPGTGSQRNVVLAGQPPIRCGLNTSTGALAGTAARWSA